MADPTRNTTPQQKIGSKQGKLATRSKAVAGIAGQERTAHKYEARVMRQRWGWVFLLIAFPFVAVWLLQMWAAHTAVTARQNFSHNPYGNSSGKPMIIVPTSGTGMQQVPITTGNEATPTLLPTDPTPMHATLPKGDIVPVPHGSIIQTFVAVRPTMLADARGSPTPTPTPIIPNP